MNELHYFTIVLPFVTPWVSEWHPTDPTGPFSRISRGAFPTEAEAHAWAKAHLNGGPYEVRETGAFFASG